MEGYRELTLPGELARARTALAGRRDRGRPANSTDDVPSDLRELFAWTIREGVTNVIRHSRARAARVVLTPDRGRDPRRRRAAAAERRRRHGLRRPARARGALGGDRRHAHARPGLLAVGGARVTIRLLLADDQALVRGALAALLGLEPDLEVVAEVGSGDEVVAAVREHHPDVALLDVEMPGLDGIEATAASRRVPRRSGC